MGAAARGVLHRDGAKPTVMVIATMTVLTLLFLTGLGG
jgi:hypothetical protein